MGEDTGQVAPARAVDRAMSLLAAVCESGPLALSDAARATGLPVSTASRLLKTLEAAGFVRRDADAAYGPGARILQLGALALSSQFLPEFAATAMERLAATTGESVYLAVPGHRSTALYVAITEGTHSVRHVNWVGRTVPLDGSAVGAVLRGLTPAKGYIAVRGGVEEDVTAIAAPIVLKSRTMAALTLLVPTYRAGVATVKDHGRRLAAATADLSERLTSGDDPASSVSDSHRN
ncbi:MAG: helix-turn-helix domain-containing protein [Bifidobacteriaceae bacterium]|nr:helix-turn-helix domain-containing protein [Bifidobacteriaceae bacterium]